MKILVLFFLLTCEAQAALVVQTCGTLPQTYAPGSTREITVDVNGNLCQ